MKKINIMSGEIPERCIRCGFRIGVKCSNTSLPCSKEGTAISKEILDKCLIQSLKQDKIVHLLDQIEEVKTKSMQSYRDLEKETDDAINNIQGEISKLQKEIDLLKGEETESSERSNEE